MPELKVSIAHQGCMTKLFSYLPEGFTGSPTKVCGASVLGGQSDKSLAALCESRWGVTPQLARSERVFRGIVSAYGDAYGELGVDRWLQLLAVGPNEKAACLISCGTALTIDVMEYGCHRGGFILPGLTMAVSALEAGTGRVRVSQGKAVFDATSLGGTTAEGVLNGVLASSVAVIEAVADRYEASAVVLTGGDADVISPHLRRNHIVEPDLILRGMLSYFEQRPLEPK